VFDALTTPRLYKQPMGAQEALKLITESSGKLFDPEIVKVFEKRIGDLERSVLNS